jgi:transcriptional regulator with XRE-family HTH domain
MQVESATQTEFPSVISGDTLEPSPFQAALFHLRQGLQALCDLTPGADRVRRQAHEELVALQRQVLQLLHVHFAPSREAKQRFGDLLRQHRAEAGLTQEQVAEFSQLSLSLIRKLEQGKKQPGRTALLSLCSIPELKLVPSEVTTLPAVREYSHRLAPNWYVSPGFDSVQMMSDFGQQLNGGGGSIEQTYVYLDHKSALDWIQLCNTPSYIAMFRESMPNDAIAQRIREVVGQVGLDVIALGPGDGKSEVRLVQQILDDSERPNIRFYLLDASQPLLNRAFKHAADTFADDSRIFVCGIQGNFHHLPRYMQLHYTPARSHRRRVYALLGNTIGNLDNEPYFFQNAFIGAAPGDLLIFDADHAFGSSTDHAEIRRCDPTLSKPMPEAYQRWLAGPIRRYCHDVQDISFSFRLDTNRPLSGSYGMQGIAKVTLLGQRTKEFCMWQVRRYDPKSIIQCMRNLDWEPVAQIPFIGTKTRPKSVFMFQKRMPR